MKDEVMILDEKQVSHSLKERRVISRFTLDEVAMKSGFSKWTIINWESGRRSPKVEDLKTYISTVFGLSLEQFFIANPTATPSHNMTTTAPAAGSQS